jgi:hypothetical protein
VDSRGPQGINILLTKWLPDKMASWRNDLAPYWSPKKPKVYVISVR